MMRFVGKIALFLLFLFLIGSCLAETGSEGSRLCYEDFKKLSNEEQIAVFSSLSSPELVGGCNQMNTVFSWGTLNSSGLITQAGSEAIH